MRLTLFLISSIALVGAVASCRSNGDSRLDAYQNQLDIGEKFFLLRYSPEGERIALAKVVEGKAAIFVTDRDSPDPVRLTSGIWDINPRWSPDGEWIAFERDSGAGDIWMIPSGGGDEVPLAVTSTQERIREWMPDGSGVIYQRDGNATWVAPVNGEAHYRLLDISQRHAAVPSPDGRYVLYQRVSGGTGTVWLFDRESGEHHQLTETGFEGFSAQPWSPDGKRFMYADKSTGTWDLWVVEAETRESRQLTRHLGNDTGGRWSPDGKWIAFTSDRGGQRDIWITASDGSGELIRVTDDPGQNVPTWSPDGTRLAYSYVSNNRRPLWRVNLDGGEARQLTDGRRDDCCPQASPDGSSVVFGSQRSGNADLWIVSSSGGEVRRLTRSPLPDESGRWSPDGSRIVFYSRRNGNGDIYTMSPDGEDVQQIIDWPSQEGGASFSPDGSTIVFSSGRDAEGTDLWTVPATRGEAIRITEDGGRKDRGYWSPDGEKIVFRSFGSVSGAIGSINVVSARGGPVTELVSGNPGPAPRWSPDGKSILFTMVESGYGYLYTVPASGGEPRRVGTETREYAVSGDWSGDGSEIVFNSFDYESGMVFVAARSLESGELRTIIRDTLQNLISLQLVREAGFVIYQEIPETFPVFEVDVARLLADRTGN